MYRGSRKHILDWVEQPDFNSSLIAITSPAPVETIFDGKWAPLGYSNPQEARLETWGPAVFGPHPAWNELKHWWLSSHRGANTPNWDIAAVGKIDGKMGLILGEAKANVPELSISGKPAAANSNNSLSNHMKIGAAIDEARQSLLMLSKGVSISRDNHYQLSNRIAFTWKVASLGIPVVLIYLGFTGDDGIRDAGEPLHDEDHWTRVLGEHLDAVGVKNLFERRIDITRAPFWMLSRSRKVIHQSTASHD